TEQALWSRHTGADLQQEVVPHQTERRPRDSSSRGYPSRPPGATMTIQADRGRSTVSLEFLVLRAAPAAELVVRRRWVKRWHTRRQPGRTRAWRKRSAASSRPPAVSSAAARRGWSWHCSWRGGGCP